MTTIRDVAARAGVSATTVSHVLNGTRKVEPETARRVHEAIAELRYRPNAIARSMRHGQTYIIGVVIPDITNPYFGDLARALESTLFEGGYTSIICNSDGDEDKEARYLEVLLSKKVDGLLIVAAGGSSERLRELAQAGPPLVAVDRPVDLPHLSSVCVDNRQGGYLVGRHLAGLGHRRIAVIAGPEAVPLSEARLDGFRAGLATEGVGLDASLIVRADFRPGGGRAAMTELLGRRPRPTAVFAQNDEMAFGALGAAHAQGLRVPEDVSIAGFDDITFSAASTPTLTTVAQPFGALALEAARLLYERLREPQRPGERVELPVELVARESTGPPVGDDEAVGGRATRARSTRAAAVV